jgi:hypothetical protein
MKKIDTIIDALRLAEEGMRLHTPNAPEYIISKELCRLHEVNAELLESLNEMIYQFDQFNLNEFEYRAINDAKAAIAKAELAKPGQEPAAWLSDSPTKGNGKQLHFTKADAWKWSSNITPLYTAPPRKEWVGLTDEDKEIILTQADFHDYHDEQVLDAVEFRLKEKNT